MSNAEPSQTDADRELYQSSQTEIEGLESFGESDQAPPPGSSREPSPRPASPPRQAEQPKARSTGSSGRRSFSVFWPLLLIMAGGLLLLQNLGYLSGLSWSTLWRWWPLLLIALGIDTLFSRRSALGGLVSVLLILALLGGAIYVTLNASSLPWMSQSVQESAWQSEEISLPLSGTERAWVVLDWASVPLRLEALEDSPNLIEGTVVYRGRLDFETVEGRRTSVKLSTHSVGLWTQPLGLEGQEQRWALGLSPRAPIDLELDGGSGSAGLDLRGLDLEQVKLDVASGAVELHLPRGEYEAWIDGGSGTLDLWLPEEAGVRLVVDEGSGALRMGERFRLVEGERDKDSVWESENLSQADSLLRIRLDVASGTVRVRDWE